jgi:UPF0716 protein FxsA
VLPLLFVIFILVPLLELYVIIQVGQEIGALPTIAILVADSILGSLLLRAQGRSAWRRFNEAVARGRVPTNEVLDGVLVIFGGAFLVTPGFLTDIAGILLLLPPTRAFVRSVLLRNVAARMAAGATSWGIGRVSGRRGRGPDGPGGPGAGQSYDVEGTATESEQRQERLP